MSCRGRRVQWTKAVPSYPDEPVNECLKVKVEVFFVLFLKV